MGLSKTKIEFKTTVKNWNFRYKNLAVTNFSRKGLNSRILSRMQLVIGRYISQGYLGSKTNIKFKNDRKNLEFSVQKVAYQEYQQKAVEFLNEIFSRKPLAIGSFILVELLNQKLIRTLKTIVKIWNFPYKKEFPSKKVQFLN